MLFVFEANEQPPSRVSAMQWLSDITSNPTSRLRKCNAEEGIHQAKGLNLASTN